MKRLTLILIMTLTVSGCKNDIVSHFFLKNMGSDELVQVLKEESNKSKVSIKEITISTLSDGTKFTISTYNGIEIEIKEKVNNPVDWWVFFTCKQDGDCNMNISDETAQIATKKDFEYLSKNHISKLINRINNLTENTQ